MEIFTFSCLVFVASCAFGSTRYEHSVRSSIRSSGVVAVLVTDVA